MRAEPDVPGGELVVADGDLDQRDEQVPALVLLDVVEQILEGLVRFEEVAGVEQRDAVVERRRHPGAHVRALTASLRTPPRSGSLSPACMRSKARLMSASGMVAVTISSSLMRPFMYRSTMPRQLRAPARAAERGAAPGAAGDEQERARVDLLARARDADDDRLAPALVRAGQRLAHHVDVADALEGVVGAAAGQLDDRRDDVAAVGAGSRCRWPRAAAPARTSSGSCRRR